MNFFDPKEDVIDLKLTQYGKHLLSKGRLSPKYYAFFDDDIIYDIKWVADSMEERQSDIEDRIQDETPRPRVQTCYYGVETEIKKINELVRQKKAKLGDDRLQPTAARHYNLSQPLGNSSLSSKKMPSWEAYFLINSLNESVDYMTGSSPNIRIPQLNAEVKFKGFAYADGDEPLSFSDSKLNEPFAEEGGDQDWVGSWGGEMQFEDGSRLVIEEDSILLEIDEAHTDYLDANFDIEVYEIKTVAASGSQSPGENKGESEELLPLYFSRLQTDLGINYLASNPEGSAQNISTVFPEVDPNYVEYFFDINVDREIDRRTICENLPTDAARRGRIQNEFKCPDISDLRAGTLAGLGDGLYDSEMADLDDFEDCD